MRRCSAIPSAFNEETDFNEQKFDSYVYRPLGDGMIVAQLDNNLGHANSGYRTSVIRALGGWDESDKSMWEDWALYLKLVRQDTALALFQCSDCMYRVRKQSMLRTYKVWPAMRRLARNTAGLPRYESFRLQAVMRHAREEEHAMRAMHSELLRIREEHAVLTAELNRRSVRAARSIVARLVKFPRVRCRAWCRPGSMEVRANDPQPRGVQVRQEKVDTNTPKVTVLIPTKNGGAIFEKRYLSA